MQDRQRRREAERRRRLRAKRRRRRRIRRLLLVVLAVGCLVGVVRGLQKSVKKPEQEKERPRNEPTMEENIRSHTSDYPDSLLQLLERNPETLQFVYDYPQEKDRNHTIDLSDEVSRGTVPLFLQWDKRWGYRTYGSDMMAITGCGPTCLSMVLCALTGDADWSPWEVAQYSEENGYYVEGTGTAWALMSQGAAELGLAAEELSLSEGVIRRRLEAGQPIICTMGPGDFTVSGHFIVLSGLNDDGTIQIRDPNSPKNSDQGWELQRLMDQMQNLWAYTVA